MTNKTAHKTQKPYGLTVGRRRRHGKWRHKTHWYATKQHRDLAYQMTHDYASWVPGSYSLEKVEEPNDQ